MKKVDNRIRMPKGFTTKWLKALTSRKYTQTTGTLEKRYKNGGSSYCCLGVACKVAGIKEIDGGDITNHHEFRSYFPKTFIKGLQTNLGVDQYGSKQTLEGKLISLNDNSKKNFKYIADYVKKNCKLV